MSETLIRHDNPDAALPHQVNCPHEWGIILPDPIPFTVTLPVWCPMDDDATVALHWWGSLSAHLHVLLTILGLDPGAHTSRYRIDKALSHALQVVRSLYGSTVSAAVSVAGFNAKEALKTPPSDLAELGAWTMALQVSFGLTVINAAAKGKEHSMVKEMAEVYEWISSAFKERINSELVTGMLMSLCTGTPTGSVDEKLAQWNATLARAAEGVPEGAVPGLELAVDPGEPLVGSSSTTMIYFDEKPMDEKAMEALGIAVKRSLDRVGMDEAKTPEDILKRAAVMGTGPEWRERYAEAVKNRLADYYRQHPEEAPDEEEDVTMMMIGLGVPAAERPRLVALELDRRMKARREAKEEKE